MGMLEHVSNIPHGSADLGRAACRKPEASDMLQHRGEPTRTCDSFEEAKIAAFALLAERAEHGQAPRGDALVRCPADKVPANPLRRFKKRYAAKMLQNLGAAARGIKGSFRKISCPPAPRIYGMPGVDWPAVGADPSRVAARFLAFLGDSRGAASQSDRSSPKK